MAAEPISHEALLAKLQRHFTLQTIDRNYKLPLFKFLKNAHAEELIKNLALRIGNISSYRDPSHGGLISDEFEGISFFKEEQQYSGVLTTHTQNIKIQIDNVYIYCTTKNFLSDSLNWALSENKDTCVLIADPVDFVSSICESTSNLTFGNGAPCKYEGRSFSLNDPRGVELFEDAINIILLKDKIYARQHEFRFAWHINSGDTNPPDYLDIKLTRLPKLIPVSYKKMEDFFDPLNWVGMVGVTVFDANDNEIGGFELEVPKKVFFPITYDDGDESYLSFYPEGGTNILSSGYFRCVGIEYTALGPLIGKFPLNLIGRIEYKFFPGARRLPGQQRAS